MINYRSIATLNRDVFAWVQKLPRDIELIVGVPRSGLLVASLLSLYMNVPLTDAEGFLEGRVIQAGIRYNGDTKELLSSAKKILIELFVFNAVMKLKKAGVVSKRLHNFQSFLISTVMPDPYAHAFIAGVQQSL